MRLAFVLLLLGFGAFLGGPVYRGLAPEQKRFAAQRIEFFLGGSKDDAFVALIERGARDAQVLYGPEIHFVWSDWDVERMAKQFQHAVDGQPDGIVVSGHPGEARLGEAIREARLAGISVTTFNVPLPNLQSFFDDAGYGYVGQDQRAAGQALARATMQASGALPSAPVLLFGVGEMGDRSERTRGIQSAFLQAGHAVKLIQVSPAMRADVEGVFRPVFREAVESLPNAIIVVDDSAGANIVDELRVIGTEPDDHFVAVYDFYHDSPAALRTGYIDLIADQQAYLQGYLAVLQACFSTQYGFRGLSIDTGIHFVTRSDIERLEETQIQGVR